MTPWFTQQHYAIDFGKKRKSLFIAEPCSDFNCCYEQRISENQNCILFIAVSLRFRIVEMNKRSLVKGFD